MTAVNVKTDCPHITSAVLPPASPDKYKNGGCFGCGDHTENWVCMSCYAVGCSSYVKGHMQEHFFSTLDQPHPHCIVASFSDLSFWCYKCEAYVKHPLLAPAYTQMHVDKFNALPGQAPITQEDMEGVFRELARPVNDQLVIVTPKVAPTYEIPAVLPLLKKYPVVDKILGLIYGNALGDAWGLSTEFCRKADVADLYKDGKVPFPRFQRNRHSVRWALGDWTDDTDQMILLMDMFAETGGAVSETLFASKLAEWVKHGFPELGCVLALLLALDRGSHRCR
eukprot:TRINITY_DN2240_c0_g1_i3.p1 TRINITY_DN2240_c0_g1~~TRINITY_DN2240_c0_g1_i3.p1  ORF type:complete len:292 (-),score=58.54 TRINITY_DN2240_c0_g1_i3:861-1703(-)